MNMSAWNRPPTSIEPSFPHQSGGGTRSHIGYAGPAQPSVAAALALPSLSAGSVPVSRVTGDLVPSWLQPFTLDENTRFTRTPDFLLRPRDKAPEIPAHLPSQRATAPLETAQASLETALSPVLPTLAPGAWLPVDEDEIWDVTPAAEALLTGAASDGPAATAQEGETTLSAASPDSADAGSLTLDAAPVHEAVAVSAPETDGLDATLMSADTSMDPQPVDQMDTVPGVDDTAPCDPAARAQEQADTTPTAAASPVPEPAMLNPSLDLLPGIAHLGRLIRVGEGPLPVPCGDQDVQAPEAPVVAADATEVADATDPGELLVQDLPVPEVPAPDLPETVAGDTCVVEIPAMLASDPIEAEPAADDAADTDLLVAAPMADMTAQDMPVVEDAPGPQVEAQEGPLELEADVPRAALPALVADLPVEEDAPQILTRRIAAPLPVMRDDLAGGMRVTAQASLGWAMFQPQAMALTPMPAPTPSAPMASTPIVLAPPAAVPLPAAAPDEADAIAPIAGDGAYELPALSLLADPPVLEPAFELSEEFLDQNSVILQQTLRDFGVRGEVIDANPGPVVTLYEFEPAPGTKSSRVIGLSADIARSMSAVSARVAVVEGRNVIGIELPNQRRETVWLRELLANQEFLDTRGKLSIALGKTIGGEPVIADLARMPHLLVAGTTGSGKSVAINTMILSLLYRHAPDACRLIMIDPKMLELSVYEGIPHLLTPVVTDPKKAIIALRWAVREMEDRYRKMSRLKVRNIDGYNARVAEARAKGEIINSQVQVGFDKETGEMLYEEQTLDLSSLPYIVIIVDEMADLMLTAGKEIEGAIQRLAQMARAAGIHLVMATQRPSVDVITGTIKANFPTRISFQVTSKIDSRTILGEMGAETLLGQGDMLYMASGGRITRVHGPFVSDQEVEKVVAHLKTQGRPEYLDAVTSEDDEDGAPEDGAVFDKGALGEETGDIYEQAVAVVMRDRKASTSYIQRRLQVGYNKAASLMERMETEGIVGPANHAGKREILSHRSS